MSPKTVTIQKPKLTLCRVLFIAFLILMSIVIFEHSRQPLREKISDILVRYATPCAPIGQYDQFNPCLIKYVEQNLLLPPSGLPYMPDNRTVVDGLAVTDGVAEKIEFIKKHFINENSPPGFFIECGANDGTFLSPTLRLEREFNWTGVLIEGNPIPFKQLVALHRNTWMVNAALCIKTYSEMIPFYARKVSGISGVNPSHYSPATKIDVPCVPLYTILAAMGKTTVDFLSLDVEGVELDILNTVPYEMLTFKIMIVEHAHVPGFQNALIDFLEPKGYKFIGSILSSATQDSLFVHESVYTSDMTLKVKYHGKPGK